MMNYSKWNNPKNYARMTAELAESVVSETPIFAVRENEHIEHSFVQYCMTSMNELYDLLDGTDIAIIEEVAAAKYLNSLQIYEYITLRGFDVTRPRLRKRILKLMKYHVIQENEMVSAGFEHGLKYYELDYFGHTFAVESGVVFHMGNRYVSYSRRKEKGISGDTPCDVKRILVGNQIVLNLLMSNTQMQRFGIMETMRANDLEQAGEDCMIRTAANVRIDEESVLAYEVVRDIPDSYAKLLNKIERYYNLVNNKAYLAQIFMAIPHILR